MNTPAPTPRPSFAESRRALLLGCGGLIFAAVAAYANSFSGPFIFDDLQSILDNTTIVHLRTALFPPHGSGFTVSGRPVLNLSFALNYAHGGTAVWSYHALNLAIHLLAGLTLTGIVRRTLLQPRLRGRFGPAALPLALAVALLWTVHPLQTESVTYISQRAESLMGLFYLLTLYSFIRGATSRVPGRWYAASVTACLLGMGTKEVMATAPLLVVLYDRTFVAGSFRAAWRQRRWWHLGLAATWLPLAWLVAGTGWNRGGTAGFDVGVAPWEYWLTQFEAMARYLWLSVWPHPLVFDYGTFWVKQAVQVVPYALIVVPVVAGMALAVRRWPSLGFLGAWFFVILAPTSLMPGTNQMIVEHRLYLSLAAVVVAEVLALHAWLGRRSGPVLVALVVGLGLLTVRRNVDYRSAPALWGDTVAKRPGNDWGHNNLGVALYEAGRLPEAVAEYEEALRLHPENAEAHNNLGNVLLQLGRLPEAEAQFQEALRIKPLSAAAHYNLGIIRVQSGRMAEAMAEFEEALRLDPENAAAHNNLGNVLLQLGRLPEAVAQYEHALRRRPDDAKAHYNLGNALFQSGRLQAAVAEYEEAVRLDRDNPTPHKNLGNALMQLGRAPEAMAQFEEVLRIEPHSAQAHCNFGVILLQLGRLPEAKAQFEQALRLQPDFAPAREYLNQLEALQPATNLGR